MSATSRLLRIELRRSIALWFAPALAALVIWGTLSTMRPDGAPTTWERSGTQLGLMFVVAAIIMCGLGAWAAGRAQRRQTADLLATVPRPVWLQDMALLTGVVTWAVVACVAAGAGVFAVTHRDATWGEPALNPVVIGLLTVIAGTSIGFCGGALVSGRFAAALLAVAFSTALFLLGTRSTSVAYLSPLAMDPRGFSPYDVFYRAPKIPLAQMCIWLAGVTACALAVTVLRSARTLAAVCMLVLASGVAVTGAVALTRAFVHPPWERIYAGQPLAEYEPVCVERSIPICAHPAYDAFLHAYAARFDRVVRPLAGIPGGPARAEQLPSRQGLRPDGTLEIVPGAAPVAIVARDLVSAPEAELTPAQQAIAFWLLEQAGEPTTGLGWLFGQGQPDTGVRAAIARFASLDPDAQRAWLSEHYLALRAGRIDLGDLP